MNDAMWAVLPAAGVGRRMASDRPKQYLQLAGATVLEHSLRALLACERITGIVVTLHAQDTRAQTLDILDDPRVTCATGGARRCDSVLAGLRALSPRARRDDWVLVHDAARPCVSPSDINSLVNTVVNTGIGGLLAQPVVDTLKRVDNRGLVVCTVEREHLFRAQTPQMFRLGQLQDALHSAIAAAVEITDEAAAMELAGQPVQVVSGGGDNLKVTLPEDLALAQWYLEQRHHEP